MSAISVRSLRQRYGKVTALDDVSFEVPEGSIFGLIGPNGAGKTTTIRVICTLLVPTAGDALVMGQSVRSAPLEVCRLLGYMPDVFGLYGELRVWEYLDFYARCYGLEPPARQSAITDVLELVDLTARRDGYVRGLSRGMAQRLGLARTLLHDPAILILDEPAAGLDPRARIELRELLRELQRLGKTILLSSHILADLSEICSHIAILEHGRLAVQGELAEVLARVSGGRTILVDVLDTELRLEQLNALLPEFDQIRLAPVQGRLRVQGIFSGDDQALAAVLARLVANNLAIVGFQEEASDLETVFMQVTQSVLQ